MPTRDMSSGNLKDSFKSEGLKLLQQKLGIKNPMAVPKLSKIVVNAGVKDAIADKKNIEKVSTVLVQITGQKPKVTKAKKSIAAFKLREGDPIGVMVTLRGKRMYDFFKKITTIVLPRLRDFHGVDKDRFDGKGNYTFGFSEYIVFPEIDPGKVDNLPADGQGLSVSITTSARDDKEGFTLLSALGMPFAKSSG